MPWRCARSRTSVMALPSAAGTSKVSTSSSMRPASIFDRSRMSLISDSRCLPEDEDVLQVVVLLLVQLAEHALDQHLGEADDGVQRRAQLVRHVRQELALVLVGDLQLPALVLDLAEQAHVLDGDHRLVGEARHQLRVALGERAAPGRARSPPRRSARPRAASARRAWCESPAARAHCSQAYSGSWRASSICTTCRVSAARPTSVPLVEVRWRRPHELAAARVWRRSLRVGRYSSPSRMKHEAAVATCTAAWRSRSARRAPGRARRSCG